MDDFINRTSLERKIRLKISNTISEELRADSLEKRTRAEKLEREVNVWKEALNMLKEEPKVHPTIKKGKWIWIQVPGRVFVVKCNRCGNKSGIRTDFCCGCGADMREM